MAGEPQEIYALLPWHHLPSLSEDDQQITSDNLDWYVCNAY